MVPAGGGRPDRDAALAELARRYLRGHGPATPEDLAAWSGLGLGDARRGFAAVAGDRGAPAPPARLPPRLLPAFDPYLLGWRDRGFAVDAEHARAVHPGGGIIRAVALVNGRAAGTWKRGRGGDRARAVRAAAAAGRRRAGAGGRAGRGRGTAALRESVTGGRPACSLRCVQTPESPVDATQRTDRPGRTRPSMPQFVPSRRQRATTRIRGRALFT